MGENETMIIGHRWKPTFFIDFYTNGVVCVRDVLLTRPEIAATNKAEFLEYMSNLWDEAKNG
jgi:hypothetical protein